MVVYKICYFYTILSAAAAVYLLSRVQLFATHGLQPSRLLCPWDFPGKNTGVGCHFLLPRIFLTQGSNPLGRQTLYHWATWEAICILFICNSSLLFFFFQLSRDFSILIVFSKKCLLVLLIISFWCCFLFCWLLTWPLSLYASSLLRFYYLVVIEVPVLSYFLVNILNPVTFLKCKLSCIPQTLIYNVFILI